jgi:hypothetical protein
MTRFLPYLTSLTLLLASGVVHGLWTERWNPSTALEEAGARLMRVPLEIGDWQGEDVETDAADYAMAGARFYWARTYTHRHGGGTVFAILMCGRAGKMAVHTPEICYRGAGYDLLETPVRTVIRDEFDAEAGVLWSARFAKQVGTASDLRLYWGWNAGDGWQASANPRWDFRGRPYLYKLYVSHELSATRVADPTNEFLQQLLPVLQEMLGDGPV